jgi:hypothetical protein
MEKLSVTFASAAAAGGPAFVFGPSIIFCAFCARPMQSLSFYKLEDNGGRDVFSKDFLAAAAAKCDVIQKKSSLF